MYEKLRTRKARSVYVTTFILLFIVLFIILLVIDYQKTTDFNETFIDVLRKVLIGILSLLIIATTYFLLIDFILPENETINSIKLVDVNETSRLHKETLKKTEFWFHDGHIGRWVRNEVFKEFISDVKNNANQKIIILVVLNPFNEEVCKAYSIYREAISNSEKDFKTLEDTQQELLATWISSQLIAQQHNNIDIKLYFKDYFQISRFDYSDEYLFETLPDPRCSAIVYTDSKKMGKSNFYNSKKRGFLSKKTFFKKIDLDSKRVNVTKITDVKEYLSFHYWEKLDDLFIEGTLNRVSSKYHPYN